MLVEVVRDKSGLSGQYASENCVVTGRLMGYSSLKSCKKGIFSESSIEERKNRIILNLAYF